MILVSVAAPGNGSGKTLAGRAILSAFPGRLRAVKFTTVYRDGANCPRRDGPCACRELKGAFTVVRDDATLLAPDTDTARLALAGAVSVRWCLARPGAHAAAWDHLRGDDLKDARAVLTEGNTILSVIWPDRLVMVMSPAVPEARWKPGTWDLVSRAGHVIVNTHAAGKDAVQALARRVAGERGGRLPAVADVSRPLADWDGGALHADLACLLGAIPTAAHPAGSPW
jgi:hypothetical protein